MDRLFYCYSYPLKEYLIKKGEKAILFAVHDKTKKRFWVFNGNEKLNSLLSDWRLHIK